MADYEFLFKITLSIIQVVCAYQVLKNERFWLLPLQLLLLCVVMFV